MKENKRILGLDILRFFTALGILSYHYFFIGPLQKFYSNDIFHPIAFWGEFGVDIFFIISGFVILFSTEKVKSSKTFLLGRAIRIYPALLICSILTLITGTLMPGTEIKDLIIRWLNSFTFYEDLWGISPLSGVYWTLMVEVKFYILTAIILKLKIWDKHKYKILLTWLAISLLNSFVLHNSIIEMLFVTKYSAHFTFGILLYLTNKGEKNKAQIPLFIMSFWMIFKNMLSYTNWIRGIYSNLIYSDIDILFGAIMIISIIYTAIKTTESKIPKKTIGLLGAWSFTLYLVHADFGFFLKTQYYLRLANSVKINEHIIMFVATILSLFISYIVLKFVNYITPKIRKKLLK